MDTISVVMPAYNAEKFIADGIESVLSQTATNWELVIVDDGSTDNTYGISKKYSAQDDRIKVFTQKNTGPSAARKYAVEQSLGEWITFLDADDCLEHDAIEIFNCKVCSSVSDIYIFSHLQGWKYHPATINCEDYRKAALRQDFNTGPVSKLFRKSLFNGGGVFSLPAGMNSGEDWLMNIRLAFCLERSATFCTEIVYRYRDINPQSLMKSFKGSWEYTNAYYEELVNSIPKLQVGLYAAEIVAILSKAYHYHWRKYWRLPSQAHTSFVYCQLQALRELYGIRPPFYQRIEERAINPAIRCVLDLAERCYGVFRRRLCRREKHKYYND